MDVKLVRFQYAVSSVKYGCLKKLKSRSYVIFTIIFELAEKKNKFQDNVTINYSTDKNHNSTSVLLTPSKAQNSYLENSK